MRAEKIMVRQQAKRHKKLQKINKENIENEPADLLAKFILRENVSGGAAKAFGYRLFGAHFEETDVANV
jgi:hypothetical protein